MINNEMASKSGMMLKDYTKEDFNQAINCGLYATVKEGIRGLSRVAAGEWGEDGINAYVVCPPLRVKMRLT